MNSPSPRSWLDRTLSVCLGLLVAAVAVYVAVRLIESVWVALAALTGSIGAVVLVVSLWRARRRGW